MVGEDGPTHHGAFDLAAYRSIPGLTIAAPSDETELKNLMFTALHQDSPMIIRYPRGTGEGRDWREAGWAVLPPGKATRLVEGERIAILALGPAAHRAVEAAADFRKEYGFTPAVYDVRYLKPLDGDMLKEVASGFTSVLTVEDGALMGGLYGAVAEYLSAAGSGIRLAGSGIPDRFIPQDTQAAERAECSIDRNGIFLQLRKLVEKD